MKKEILHIHAYMPTETTWLFENDSISRVEQVRVITVPHEAWGHNCHIEYVYVTGLGNREVWMGGDCTPFDCTDSWIFRGNIITEDLLEDLYRKQDFAETRESFYENLLYQIETYWLEELTLVPGLLDYCKEKDKKTAPS